MPQPLSSKESSLFRQVIRSYEDKQYKRGLKSADLILKKNPKHGDTMAMKALIINAQGKTEEAFALGKEALTVDMKSHICWHVYGLLYRANKNFEEAIKAYKFALRLEPESAQIQRDLAILQVQMRDYAGYVQSRTAMLQARPSIRQSWTALAVAHHLAGDLPEAEKVLTTYEGTLKTPPPRSDYENSEAVMYKNSLIAEQGDYARALEHLDSAAKNNLDRLAVLELRAEYLMHLDRKEEAAQAYRVLLDRNPEHPAYYDGLVAALELQDSNAAGRKAVYDEYAAKSSRCDAARRLPLAFLSGAEFGEAAASYLTLMLDKGVPSLFANLKHLYSDQAKQDELVRLVLKYLQDSKDKEPADEEKEQVDGDSSKGTGAALYFLAQHYNYYLSRDLEKAMQYVDQAIELDASNVDFHMTKARIWKHRGDTRKAAEAMDHARSLDLKDRYINSKAAKYQLRNNENEKALKTMSNFTKVDTVGGPLADLMEMQCIWYITEDGESYARQGNIGLALKRLHFVHNIFDVWQEDQFDFHSFSLRKGQIRAYVDTVRWEDKLREHPFYSRAALDAVAVYLQMADRVAADADGHNGVNGTGAAMNGDDAQEKKKAAKKARKEAARLEREAAEKAAKQDPNKGQPAAKEDPAKKKDEDPLGLKLAATTEPLVEAMKFLNNLLEYSPKNILGQLAGFDVFIRRKKYLLALRCLNTAIELDASHPRVHEQTVEFAHALKSVGSAMPEPVAAVFKSEFTALSSTTDLKKHNDEFAKKHADSPMHALAAIRARKILGEEKAKCEKQLVGLLGLNAITFEEAGSVLQTLKAWGGRETEAFKKAAREKWPDVTLFA